MSGGDADDWFALHATVCPAAKLRMRGAVIVGCATCGAKPQGPALDSEGDEDTCPLPGGRLERFQGTPQMTPQSWDAAAQYPNAKPQEQEVKVKPKDDRFKRRK